MVEYEIPKTLKLILTTQMIDGKSPQFVQLGGGSALFLYQLLNISSDTISSSNNPFSTP